jgi:hypothetical protein
MLLCDHETEYIHSKDKISGCINNDRRLMEVRSSSVIEIGIQSLDDSFLIEPNVDTVESGLNRDRKWYYWRL